MSVLRHELQSVTGGEDANGPNYEAEYLVTVSSPLDLTHTVVSGMPWSMGDEFSIGNDYDPRAVALSSSAEPVPSNNYRWIYKVEFGVPDADQQSNDPFSDPPTIELIFAQSEKTLERDVHGKAIQNVNKERFDDIITREDSQPVLRITRNEPRSQALFGTDIRDCINRSPWLGAPRRTVKFQPPTLRSRFHTEIGTYYEKGYELKFSDETWRFVILNQGYYSRKNPDEPPNKENLQRIRIDSKDISSPVALTSTGQELRDREAQHFLTFDGYREIIFPDFDVFL